MARSIVIGADYKVSQYLEVLLKSIFLSTTVKQDLTIYILNFDYPHDLILHYIKQSQSSFKHVNIKVLTPFKGHKRLLENLEIKGDLFSKAMYFKLFVADLLPEDSVLYLEANTLVLQDLSPLLNYQITDNVSIYACPDRLLSNEVNKVTRDSNSYLHVFNDLFKQKALQQRHYELLHENGLTINTQVTANLASDNLTLEQNNLFSTEVMILNLKRIRDQQLQLKYLDYLASDKVVNLPHANLFLNLVHANDWQALPDTYNFQVDYINRELYDMEQAGYQVTHYSSCRNQISYNLPHIVSFTGRYRPLNSNKKMAFRRLFIEIYKDSISEIIINRNLFRTKDIVERYTYIHLLRLDESGWYKRDLSLIQPEWQGVIIASKSKKKKKR